MELSLLFIITLPGQAKKSHSCLHILIRIPISARQALDQRLRRVPALFQTPRSPYPVGLRSRTMPGSYDSFDDWSNGDGSACGDSSDGGSVDLFQSGHTHPGEQTFALEGPPFYANDEGNPSINSSGSGLAFYPESTASVSRPTPGSSASQYDRSYACSLSSQSSSSSLGGPDSILEHFRECQAPSAVSPVRQSTGQSIVSFGQSTRSTRTVSYGAESIFDRAEEEVESPATSEANEEVNIPLAAHQDLDDQELATPSHIVLVGLGLQDDHQLKSPFRDANTVNHPGNQNEIVDLLETLHANLRRHRRAIPWMLGTQAVGQTTIGDSTLAPSAGLVSGQYDLLKKVLTRGNQMKVQGKTKAPQKNSEGFVGTSKAPQHISPYILAQYSNFEEQLQRRRWRDSYNGNEASLRQVWQQFRVCRGVHCSMISPESFGSMFYPEFAVSHLNNSSLPTFSTELIAPGGISYNSDFSIDFSLGFGPAIKLQVCTFTPKDKTVLQTYQKLKSEEKLQVQESLPLFLNVFSVEEHARDIGIWLDQTIDSETRLRKFLQLMHDRYIGDCSAQILKDLVASPSIFRNEVFRDALKLLMTATLLILVPRVKDIPEPLSLLLAPQPFALNSPHLSAVAPKLLTRQIKASIRHLQHHLLNSISCYFASDLELAAEVKVAVALLIALVLDLIRHAVENFATHANAIDSRVFVDPHHVTEYEKNVETQVFGRVRASVLGVKGDIGRLGGILNVTSCFGKGKGKETPGRGFVSAILNILM